MTFKDALEPLVEDVPGAVAAMIIGYDGIPLEDYEKVSATGEKNELDLQTVGVEYSTLLHEVRKNAENLGVSGMEELSVRSENWTFLIRLINPEYFLILALSSIGYSGKGRYLMRNACSQVRSQL